MICCTLSSIHGNSSSINLCSRAWQQCVLLQHKNINKKVLLCDRKRRAIRGAACQKGPGFLSRVYPQSHPRTRLKTGLGTGPVTGLGGTSPGQDQWEEPPPPLRTGSDTNELFTIRLNLFLHRGVSKSFSKTLICLWWELNPQHWPSIVQDSDAHSIVPTRQCYLSLFHALFYLLDLNHCSVQDAQHTWPVVKNILPLAFPLFALSIVTNEKKEKLLCLLFIFIKRKYPWIKGNRLRA